MRRYRVLKVDFDTRANLLSIKIDDGWDETIKAFWHQMQAEVRTGLVAQFGTDAHDRKVSDFCELGAPPFSVIAFHNTFYRQARYAFAVGGYYPALTAACALGERILNHMVLLFRDDFTGTPEFKRVFRKDSFDDWNVAIDTLCAWRLLLPETADSCRRLRDIRNRSLHFNPVTDKDARSEALLAMRSLHEVIERQFTALGDRPWYIPNDISLTFVRKASEKDPFVAKVLLPNCALVGPAHDLRSGSNGEWEVIDPEAYPDTEISDSEFIEQFKARHGKRAG